ncbi:G1/S-specific cyclin-E-like isoform X1 [Lingula anatina]|uniref:G1/S-specific cyclin-E-like isoform X1 n=1 Tax=Lingula anatina TaxID=7574 RepID=A0A1S3K2D2_LINAN|nr:G1/S-specific cyclin-E-like isoform X1 [Lingula anatina]|eukprot:XP_013416426.1 G1/S-specific cyclin-E-like isoform X1 [Lingula anatina]
MSRRSIRLLRNRKTKEVPEEKEIFGQKRKVEEVDEDSDREMQVNKRRQQFQIQNQWVPISQDTKVITSTLVPTRPSGHPLQEGEGHERLTPPDQMTGGTRWRFQNLFTTPMSLRPSPLPKINWADHEDVWTIMLKKDLIYANSRKHDALNRHPTLQSKMRAILLDWLIEVCEVYRLHRETFYLSLDFLDRYLTVQTNVQKHQLQLLGITCLFIAAKLEEIYPPKLSEFAYVTDGACTENQILCMELVVLKALNWDLAPMTVISWLNVYMQLIDITNSKKDFILPQYSAHYFVQIARLLDLCMLDTGCLQFSYSVIAASALYHMSSDAIAFRVSSFKWLDIGACSQWMAAFARTVREEGLVEQKFFPNVLHEEAHNVQTHSVDLKMLERAQELQLEIELSSRASPDLHRQSHEITMLTPPSSSRKSHQDLQS